MHVLRFLLTFVGKPRYFRDVQETQSILDALTQRTRLMRTFAHALIHPQVRPPATYGRTCDYYDSCPFRVSQKAQQDFINGELSQQKQVTGNR